jgi:fumarylpyruvate hydrolase
MTSLLFPLSPPSLPVQGQDAHFPVRRIYCVGRNYAAHALEMGVDPKAEPPIFFMKPADAVLPLGGTMPFPRDTANLHHEVELAVALHKGGHPNDAAAALELVFGYAVALDLTKRDRQGEAKNKGQPWERGKSFDHSAPISALAPASAIGHPREGRIALTVNGEVRQDADLKDLIWSVGEIIVRLAEIWDLGPGDLILTGTPEGVGAVQAGDRLEATIAGVGALSLTLTREHGA